MKIVEKIFMVIILICLCILACMSLCVWHNIPIFVLFAAGILIWSVALKE